IEIIAAGSPQAKGRVERSNGTQQDRLIKKMRLLGIADDAAANAYVEASYLPKHNARYTVAAVVRSTTTCRGIRIYATRMSSAWSTFGRWARTSSYSSGTRRFSSSVQRAVAFPPARR